MALTDEEYARALEQQRQHQVAYIKLELEKQKLELARQQQTEQEMLGALTGALGLGAGYSNSATQQASNTSGLVGNPLQAAHTAINPAQQQASWLSQNAYQQSIGGLHSLNEHDLKHDAMKAPLSALVDMWTVRWGGEWVSGNEFQEDDFWRLALVRLIGAHKLEKHNLVNSYAPVYRIIE